MPAIRRLRPLGTRYGMLVVIGEGVPVYRAARNAFIPTHLFRCDCGNETSAKIGDIERPHAKGRMVSCGCYRKTLNKSRGITHGMSSSRTWRAWKSMKMRCRAGDSRTTKNHGDRGIRVCERWETFENFLADMGEAPPDGTVDRIDNNGHYEPSNCRWATMKEQGRNRRNNVVVQVAGISMCLTEAAETLGITVNSINKARLTKKLGPQQAMEFVMKRNAASC